MTARSLILIAAYGGLVIGGVLAGPWLAGLVQYDLRPINEPQVHRMVLLVTAIFVLTAALPFVPGAEIGLAMMVMMGSGIATLVYLGMVAALVLAFVVGRLVPARVTAAGLGFLGLRRAHDLMLRLEPLDKEHRLQVLASSAPRRFIPFLLRHRYLMLGLAFNLPGNTLLGGGGGIAMCAGLSGLYSSAGFVITVAIAVAPVPLIFMISGALP